MSPEVKQYLLHLLTAMGQMDHPHRNDVTRDVMHMKVEIRQELLDTGWKLLDDTHSH